MCRCFLLFGYMMRWYCHGVCVCIKYIRAVSFFFWMNVDDGAIDTFTTTAFFSVESNYIEHCFNLFSNIWFLLKKNEKRITNIWTMWYILNHNQLNSEHDQRLVCFCVCLHSIHPGYVEGKRECLWPNIQNGLTSAGSGGVDYIYSICAHGNSMSIITFCCW